MEEALSEVFLGHDPKLVAGRHGTGVHHIEVRTPVVPAGTRQRRPPEDGLDPLRGRQREGIQGIARPVLHGSLAAEFSIPDAELAVEIPETRKRHELDSVGGRRGPHGQKRLHDLQM